MRKLTLYLFAILLAPAALFSQPENDNFADAIFLEDLENWCSDDADYTTVDATADEAKGSCWSTGPSYNVWFKFVASSAEIEAVLRTGGDEGTLRYPYIALWDASLTQLACKGYVDASADIGIACEGLTEGNTYYISVDNHSNASYKGTFSLCVSDEIDYDFKEGAVELSDLDDWCSADAAYSTEDATQDQSKGSCWNTGPSYN
ncbi:MAG: hypothetical protein KJ607_08425, partial [Bacteroidetes bacterium]|nr:hypothetical protein [Bacteroidota bacterium]